MLSNSLNHHLLLFWCQIVCLRQSQCFSVLLQDAQRQRPKHHQNLTTVVDKVEHEKRFLKIFSIQEGQHHILFDLLKHHIYDIEC